MYRLLIIVLLIVFHASPSIADGAIAINRTGTSVFYGIAVNRLNFDDAANEAKANCNSQSSTWTCHHFSLFRRTCAAVASSQDNKLITTATDNDQAVASANAINICQDYTSAGNCRIVETVCDSLFGTYRARVEEDIVPFVEEHALLISAITGSILLLLIAGFSIVMIWRLKRQVAALQSALHLDPEPKDPEQNSIQSPVLGEISTNANESATSREALPPSGGSPMPSPPPPEEPPRAPAKSRTPRSDEFEI